MAEKIYTIPLNDAFHSDDECPFCYLERQAEEHAISFILGSAYMEDDIRAVTDKKGFCRDHYKKMYNYGNQLGNALMLKTHFKKTNEELIQHLNDLSADNETEANHGFFKKIKSNKASASALKSWAIKHQSSCYVCDHIDNLFPRYVSTFFELVQTDQEFLDTIRNSNGFCIPHFVYLIDESNHLNAKQKSILYPIMTEVMIKNMQRVEEDISWFVDKFDYRNKDADWKNAKDAVPRAMVKVAGGHPGDPYFMGKR